MTARELADADWIRHLDNVWRYGSDEEQILITLQQPQGHARGGVPRETVTGEQHQAVAEPSSAEDL